MKSTVKLPRVTMEQLFNEFFVCLYLNTLQPHLSYCWTGNFIFQSSLHGSQSRWNNVKMQMGIWIHCSVVPRHTAPGSAMSTPWGCTSTIQGIVKSPHSGARTQAVRCSSPLTGRQPSVSTWALVWRNTLRATTLWLHFLWQLDFKHSVLLLTWIFWLRMGWGGE